jgi:hypothetical protein
MQVADMARAISLSFTAPERDVSPGASLSALGLDTLMVAAAEKRNG